MGIWQKWLGKVNPTQVSEQMNHPVLSLNTKYRIGQGRNGSSIHANETISKSVSPNQITSQNWS